MDNNHVNERPVATREVHHGGAAGRGTSAVAWIALLLSLLALTLAWTAFNRTGEDLENRIQQGVNSAAESVEQSTDTTQQEAQPEAGSSSETDTTTDTTTDANGDVMTDETTTPQQ